MSRKRHGIDKVYIIVSRRHKAVEIDVAVVEKIGYGVKPSLFVMCNFYDLVINIH
jgi:hypothetical protein